MASINNQNIKVGIDIGTSKVVCLVVESIDDGLNVLGLGTHPSKGLKNGVVVDIESTVQAIQEATNKAELMSGIRVHQAYVGISGGSSNGLNSEGVVPIKDKKVKFSDVEKVITAAKAQAIPDGYKLLHILAREYAIDQQNGIKEPLGMAGVRLEAKVHLVSCDKNAAENISSCMRACGITVQDYVLEQLASSYSVLSDDEKRLGVCLIDLGGGTSDVAIFMDDSISHTVNIPVGGDHVTNDIARAIQTPTSQAEELKKKYGCASSSLTNEGDKISTPSINGRSDKVFSRQALADVIEHRYAEIFQMIKQRLGITDLSQLLPAGIVLTGGASKIEGISQLGEEIFQVPVRVGKPKGLVGLTDILKNPVYSTSIGLILYGQKITEEEIIDFAFMREKGLVNRAFKWIQNNF